MVVEQTPARIDHLGLADGLESLPVQTLSAWFVVKTFEAALLPRFAGFDRGWATFVRLTSA